MVMHTSIFFTGIVIFSAIICLILLLDRSLICGTPPAPSPRSAPPHISCFTQTPSLFRSGGKREVMRCASEVVACRGRDKTVEKERIQYNREQEGAQHGISGGSATLLSPGKTELKGTPCNIYGRGDVGGQVTSS